MKGHLPLLSNLSIVLSTPIQMPFVLCGLSKMPVHPDRVGWQTIGTIRPSLAQWGAECVSITWKSLRQLHTEGPPNWGTNSWELHSQSSFNRFETDLGPECSPPRHCLLPLNPFKSSFGSFRILQVVFISWSLSSSLLFPGGKSFNSEEVDTEQRMDISHKIGVTLVWGVLGKRRWNRKTKSCASVCFSNLSSSRLHFTASKWLSEDGNPGQLRVFLCKSAVCP